MSEYDSILGFLEEINGKLDRLLAKKEPTVRHASPGFPFAEQKPEPIPATSLTNFALPMTGKYQWYKLKGDDKVKLRKCSNEGCLMFLKWNGDKKKYEHWKYDPNTGVGGYVQDSCDHYEGGF